MKVKIASLFKEDRWFFYYFFLALNELWLSQKLPGQKRMFSLEKYLIRLIECDSMWCTFGQPKSFPTCSWTEITVSQCLQFAQQFPQPFPKE